MSCMSASVICPCGGSDASAAAASAAVGAMVVMVSSLSAYGAWRGENVEDGIERIRRPDLDLLHVVRLHECDELLGILLHRERRCPFDEFEDRVELVAEHDDEVHQIGIEVAVVRRHDLKRRVVG